MIQQTYLFNPADQRQKRDLIKIATHVVCLLPLSMFIGRELARLHIQNELMRTALIFSGRVSVALLLLSLVMTPLKIVFGWKALLPLRKSVGLYSFAYATAHLFIHVGFGLGFEISLIWEDFLTRPAAQIGYAAFLILFLLTLTSVPVTMRMVGRWWKNLHRTVYIGALLVIWHWLFVANLKAPWPLAGLVGLSLLLYVRTQRVQKAIAQLRKNSKQRSQPTIYIPADEAEGTQLPTF